MKIQVIVGSNRPGRVTERVAHWVMHETSPVTGADFELVDLADFELPFLDEPISPRFNPHRPTNAPGRRWLAKLAEADGYIIVTPEYNHSIPGVLKNALDYIDFQIQKKPVAIVSHGSVGGARAAEQLKLILIESGAAVVPKAVTLVRASALIDESGRLLDPETPHNPGDQLQMELTELLWWTQTLKAGRAAAVTA